MHSRVALLTWPAGVRALRLQTKRHRTDRNRDTPQTTERRHEHTEQATGQVQVQVTHTTHHSDSQPPSHSDSTGRRQAHPLARAGRPTYCVHAPASLWVAPLTVVGAGVRASLRSKINTHTQLVSSRWELHENP